MQYCKYVLLSLYSLLFRFISSWRKTNHFQLWAVTFNILLCLLAYFYSAAAYKVGFPERVWANLGEPPNLAASTEMGSPQLSMSPANVVVRQTANVDWPEMALLKKG